jgi:hypothetical protein
VSVLLHRSGHVPPAAQYDSWISIAGALPADSATELENVARRFEDAFDAIAEEWLAFAREIGSEPSAELSHLPTCAANISDFGEMLAWTHLVDELALDATRRVLVICDDPWLFRHLAMRERVVAGSPPPFACKNILLFVRGYGARLRYALRAAVDTFMLRAHRKKPEPAGTWLLVYGHPLSDPVGYDGYFGDLPEKFPALRRALHVDCSYGRAQELAAGGRIVSLRAWGTLLTAISLFFVRWRPGRTAKSGKFGWLVRRAAALEGGTAQSAAIRWQILCQNAWLAATAPAVVAWPWENHSWERCFVRTARISRIQTLGYQHSVIGRQMLNYSPQSCSGGQADLPDRILCVGQSTQCQLAAWGVSSEKMAIGGALRFPAAPDIRCDPAAPIFVALPFDRGLAAEMMSGVAKCSGTRRDFAVRDHPMTPFFIKGAENIRRADGPLGQQRAVSAVLYAATTVGLEALIAGLPTLRFRSRRGLAINILPPGLDVPAADLHSLPDALRELKCSAAVDRKSVFADPDIDVWRSHLEAL